MQRCDTAHTCWGCTQWLAKLQTLNPENPELSKQGCNSAHVLGLHKMTSKTLDTEPKSEL